MPIEIRELNIRVNVAEQGNSKPSKKTPKNELKKFILDTCAEMIAESKQKSKER